MCLRRSCTQSISLQQNTEAVGSWDPPEHHPEPQVYNIKLSSHKRRLSLNWRHRYRSCQVLLSGLACLATPTGQWTSLCSRTQASPQGLRAMKELVTSHTASPTPSGDSPTAGKGGQSERQGLGPPAHALAARGTPHLSGNAEDFLAQSSDHLLTSGPEIPSKDLMHQGSSLRLPIQPKRKPQP